MAKTEYAVTVKIAKWVYPLVAITSWLYKLNLITSIDWLLKLIRKRGLKVKVSNA